MSDPTPVPAQLLPVAASAQPTDTVIGVFSGAVAQLPMSAIILPSNFGATPPIAVSFPSGVATYALNIDSNFAVVSSNLALASIASGNLLANAASTPAEPTTTTLQALMNRALGTTRGAILESGTGGWNIVLPGTVALPWISNGSGADPAYQSLTYAGIQNVGSARLLGNPTGAPAVPSEISLGGTLSFTGTALQTLAATGDVTWPQNSFVTTLATVNSNVGTFGSATRSITLTVNGKGLVTAASDTFISPLWSSLSSASSTATLNGGPLTINTANNTGNLGLVLDGPNSALIASGTITPSLIEIVQGSPGTPYATPAPTILISRNESMANGTSPCSNGGADASPCAPLNIVATTNNTQQLTGLRVFVTTNASSNTCVGGPGNTSCTNDNVAVYGVAIMNGNANQGHSGYASFFLGQSNTIGNTGIAVGTAVINATGANQPYAQANTPNFTALDAAGLTGVGTTYFGVAVQIRTGSNALWDVGIAAQPQSINSAFLRDDSNSATVLLVNSGSHTTGIDLTGGTYTGANQIVGPGFAINATGSSLALGGRGFLTVSGISTPYNEVVDTAANPAFLAGGGGSSPDHSNYYRNTAHIFGNIAGATTYLTINASGANFAAGVGIGGAPPATGAYVYGALVNPTANGQAAIGTSSTNGGLFGGQGSVNDGQLVNKNGTAVCTWSTGTTTFACVTLVLTNPLASSSGGTGVNNGSSTITLGAALTTTGTGAPTLAFPSSSFTYTFQGSSDTIVGRATTDTLTNKTFDTAGAGNVFKINGTQISAVTGIGSAVLATSPTIATPTFTTNITVPLIYGGTAAGSHLDLQSTSSGSPSGDYVRILTAGAEQIRMLNNGTNPNLLVGLTAALQTNMMAGFKGSGSGTTFIGQDPLATNIAGLWMGTGATPSGSNHTLLADGASTYLNAATSNIYITIAGATVAQHYASGGLYLGASPADPGANNLQVQGQMFMPNITTSSAAQTGTVCWTTGTGKFTVDTTVGCLTSVEEAKDIISYLEPADALGIVNNLRPFSFRYRPGYGDGGRYEQFGLGANQAASIDERIAGRDADGILRGVRYMEFTAVLTAAIKQLKADNDDLRARLSMLEAA